MRRRRVARDETDTLKFELPKPVMAVAPSGEIDHAAGAPATPAAGVIPVEAATSKFELPKPTMTIILAPILSGESDNGISN